MTEGVADTVTVEEGEDEGDLEVVVVGVEDAVTDGDGVID